MPATKISDLDTAPNPPTTARTVPLVDGGANYQSPVGALLTGGTDENILIRGGVSSDSTTLGDGNVVIGTAGTLADWSIDAEKKGSVYLVTAQNTNAYNYNEIGLYTWGVPDNSGLYTGPIWLQTGDGGDGTGNIDVLTGQTNNPAGAPTGRSSTAACRHGMSKSPNSASAPPH